MTLDMFKNSAAKDRRFRSFKKWMDSMGFTFSDSIRFCASNDFNLSVFTSEDLKPGLTIAKIPKSACLTWLNTSISEILEANMLSGNLGLAVAIMHEKSLKEKSFWYEYLAVIPEKESIPFTWSEIDIKRLLTGTEIFQVVLEDKKSMYQDWCQHIQPLSIEFSALFPHKYFSFDCYVNARSIMASRSFSIDEYHGFGLVPLADLFNHKTANEDVHLTDVRKSTTNNSSEADEEEEEDNSVDMEGEETESRENDVESQEDEPGEDLEMIMVKNVRAGSEVFNTYGELSNAALLHRYGFTEQNNPYDIVNVDMELVFETVCSVKGPKSSHLCRDFRQRVRLLVSLGFLPLRSAGSQYFEIEGNGKPQLEMLALIRVALLPPGSFDRLVQASAMAESQEGPNLDLIAEFLNEGNKVKPWQQRRTRLSASFEATLSFLMGGLEAVLLSKQVLECLLHLLDARERLYETEWSLEDDKGKMRGASMAALEYHAMGLRVSEREVIAKCRRAVLKDLELFHCK